MEPIIAPIDKALLRQELTRKLFLRKTNRGNNEIYIFTAQEAPNAMREVVCANCRSEPLAEAAARRAT